MLGRRNKIRGFGNTPLEAAPAAYREPREGMDNKNRLTHESSIKTPNLAGAYSAVAILTVLFLTGILVLVNLLFHRLPSSVTAVDLSADGLYSLDTQTVELISSLDRETDIFWLVEGGKENTQIAYLLDRYAELSDCIHTEKVDPVVSPDFARDYTDTQIHDNSLLITMEGRGRYLDYYDLFTVDYGTYGDAVVDTVFRGEDLLTGAVYTLVNAYDNVIYTVSGHNEAELPASLTRLLERDNYHVKTLRLLLEGIVPEDADAVLLAAPEKDLSEAESRVLLEYLGRGGNLLGVTSYHEDAMPEIESLLAACGLEKRHGIVFEGNADRYYGTWPMYLLPEIRPHDITNAMRRGGYYLLLPNSDALCAVDASASGYTVEALLESSSASYLKSAGYAARTTEREAGDADGPFMLAAAVSGKTPAGESRAVWISSERFLSEEADTTVSGSNAEFLMGALSWLTGRDLTLNIRPRYLTSGKLVIPGGAKTRYGFLLLGLIPGVFVLAGIWITLRRRRR